MTSQDERMLKDVLARINAEYEPGCIEFYSNFTPDQWQAAVQCLELAIEMNDTVAIRNQLVLFENTCSKLIKNYRDIRWREKSRERFLQSKEARI